MSTDYPGGLAAIERWAEGLLRQLSPAQTRQLAGQIARTLRASNQARITAQQTPEGAAFVPRKPQPLRAKKGKIRAGKMFPRLKMSAHLKARAEGGTAAVVDFAGAVQRIARVHHHGLRDRVSARNTITVVYPSRPLLGIAPDDEARLEDLVIRYLGALPA